VGTCRHKEVVEMGREVEVICNDMEEICGHKEEVVVMERVEVEMCSNKEVLGVDSSWRVEHSKAYHNQHQH